VGPHEGRKAFCLQSLPPAGSLEESNARVAKVAGFSLHAGVAAARHERQKLERLCRYITRPAIAEPRLSLTPSGNVRCQLKTPYRDRTTHVIFEPLDFMYRKYGMPRAQGCAGAAMARLAALGTQSTRCARGVGSAAAAGEPDALPRGVCTEQPAPGPGDEGGSGPCDTRSWWLSDFVVDRRECPKLRQSFR
jgi:hypothetical protein